MVSVSVERLARFAFCADRHRQDACVGFVCYLGVTVYNRCLLPTAPLNIDA